MKTLVRLSCVGLSTLASMFCVLPACTNSDADTIDSAESNLGADQSEQISEQGLRVLSAILELEAKRATGEADKEYLDFTSVVTRRGMRSPELEVSFEDGGICHLRGLSTGAADGPVTSTLTIDPGAGLVTFENVAFQNSPEGKLISAADPLEGTLLGTADTKTIAALIAAASAPTALQVTPTARQNQSAISGFAAKAPIVSGTYEALLGGPSVSLIECAQLPQETGTRMLQIVSVPGKLNQFGGIPDRFFVSSFVSESAPDTTP